MTKRNGIGFIYFGVVVASLLLRIASALDVYSALGVKDTSAFYTCVVQLLIFGVMPLALYFLTVARRDGARQFVTDFGIKKVSGRNCARVLVIAICMIVVTYAVSYFWQSLLSLMGFTRVPSQTDYSSIGVLFKELVLVAVLPALFEELTHRGLIYAGYRECGWKFVLISAVYFSLMHQNIVQTGYTFFGGTVMALAMYYTGSIFPSIFIHFLNNAVSVIGGYIAQNGGVFSFITKIENWIYGSPAGIAVGMVVAVICAAILIFMFMRMRRDAVKGGLVDERPFAPSLADTKPLYADIPFIITVVLGIGATAFSLAWGLMR